MSVKKEAIEINCAECSAAFRLWVPQEMLPEWERGARISCIRCGAEHLVKKGAKGFDVIHLPMKREAEKPAPAPAREPQPVRQEPVSATVYREAVQATLSRQTPQQVEQTSADLETILVVEDDKFSRQMVETGLANMGYKVLIVKNAAEALKAFKKDDVKLVVTDLYLKNPGDPESQLDGEEMLKRLTDTGIHVPAIITTGKDIIDDLVLDPKWFDLHVKGFIQKGNPFWTDELKDKIKEVLYKD